VAALGGSRVRYSIDGTVFCQGTENLKKVFHVITTINRGGAENQLLVLVREQVKIGLDVHVLYLKGEPELEEDFRRVGATVHHELSRKSVFMQPFHLRKVIGKDEVIVHAHLPRAELASVLKPKNARLFVSRHNAEPFFPGAPTLLSNILSRIVEMRSSRVIAISFAVRNYLITRGEVRNPDEIEVILYGYERHFQIHQNHTDKDFSICKIGSISRLADQKDIPTMLRAFKIFHEAHPQSTLSILGAGPLDSELKCLTRSMGLSDSVIFRGRSSNIYEFLSELDAFILTSKYEGFGMVLLEAMDSGLPIVASSNSAIPEVLGLDFLGLCQTGDAAEFSQRLDDLNDVTFRSRVLDQQKTRLNIFSADQMCQRLLAVYLS
jgi:glycosyltransferase involved in cell wall biosynthesis